MRFLSDSPENNSNNKKPRLWKRVGFLALTLAPVADYHHRDIILKDGSFVTKRIGGFND